MRYLRLLGVALSFLMSNSSSSKTLEFPLYIECIKTKHAEVHLSTGILNTGAGSEENRRSSFAKVSKFMYKDKEGYSFKSSVVNEGAILNLVGEAGIFVYSIDLESKRYVGTAHTPITFLSLGASATMQEGTCLLRY